MLQSAKRKPSSTSPKPSPIPPSKKLNSGISISKAAMALNAQIAVGSSILDEPVNYRDLKAWIEEQERNPRPLSPLQQRAISDLRRSLEPKVDERDWVTLMNRTRTHLSLLRLFH
jgi:hypothetical protein